MFNKKDNAPAATPVQAPLQQKRVGRSAAPSIISSDLVVNGSLASTVTLMEVTGIAAKIIAATYRPVEVFICAAVIYLAVNFIITRAIQAMERSLSH